MSFSRFIWITIVRRNYHTICLFLLVLVLSLVGIIGYYLRNIINNYQNYAISDIGYSINLYRKNGIVEPELLDQILEIDGVIGYNWEGNVLVDPVDFINVVQTNNSSVYHVTNFSAGRGFVHFC